MKIAFWFKSGRRARLREGGPREFFYGYPDLAPDGAELVEDVDLPEIKNWGGIPKLLFRFLDRFTRWNTGYMARLMLRKNRQTMQKYDWIVGVTTTHALAFGLMQRLGIYNGRVLAVTTGLVENFEHFWQWPLTRWILAKCDLVSLSRGEAAEMERRFQRLVGFLPFAIDEEFWTPEHQEEDYVLSVGNDRHRDFELLIRVWKPEWPTLKILTTQVLDFGDKKNIEKIKGDWHGAAVSDEGLRELYRRARLVVVPVKEVWQPSGQSVTLQAMSCGKIVVLAQTPGLWDPEVMRHGENVLLYSAGNLDALGAQIAEGLRMKDSEMPARARETVVKHYGIALWSRQIRSWIQA